METTVTEVASLVAGLIVQGEGARQLSGFGALDNSEQSDLSFFGNLKYQEAFENTRAGAVLVSQEVTDWPQGVAVIQVENPIMAFDIVIRKFGAPEVPFESGIHPSAFVAEGVELDPSRVSIGAMAVIETGCKIGNGTRIGPNVTLAREVIIGESCEIHPQVSLREGTILGNRIVLHSGTVIGSDGFGYEFADGVHQKIRQAGIVEIGNDVEIGANCSIDRARFGSTMIGEGTKIDNNCQIGHNARIGKHCILVAQVGISGSAIIGDYVILGAQCGVAGHVKVGAKTIFGGRSGVIADVPDDSGTYFGYPAKPMKEHAKLQMHQKKIPTLQKEIRELKQRLAELES